MRVVAFLLVLLMSTPVLAAQSVALRGKDFYLDGKPRLAKGVDVNAFVKPPKFFSFNTRATDFSVR
ncbi:hypothetical protein [Nitrospirillum viridazoti]|uniref:Uncharacterized protein n=1 Tax=Nitrospirillum viridazoti CBAmc TaxID=1441467 RepID=A0A248K161_9PROT|nr:hypothetical protein [Nitrospirillum amazonense]ASG24471.1 hypothetical protein Y958_26735 [Nitrospirillum amazonense CBAmc]TWB37186.1 hypothetical protein FBZ91_108258 [Nitrospirillum amazonense]